jgi:DNA-binding NarL/FixJ family response regulator
MIRILLVDDQKIIREALKIFLEPEIDFQIIGTADNGMYALEKVEELRPDIVLMNIEMPGLDGTRATQIITNKFTDTKVLILSSYDSDEYIAKSLSVGARGYLLKDTDSQDIVAAIRSVYKGYTQIGPGLLEKLLIQTDSGIILSKFRSTTYQDDNPTLGTEKQLIEGVKSTDSNLQSTFYKQRIELNKLGNGLNKIAQELPQITKTIASYYKYVWRIWIFLLTSMPIISLILFSLYTKINNLEINSIPTERVGLYGESNLNGLAQRVVEAFKQDSILSNISNVYVAQNGNTVVLIGTISNSNLLKRMENIAQDVEGVTQVDTSQVKVR